MNPHTIEVANIIREQLGTRTFYMLGAKNLSAFDGDAGPGLKFRIRGSERVNGVLIELDEGSDFYVVAFVKIGRAPGRTTTVVARFEGMAAEDLHQLIEAETGLATSLGTLGR